MFTQCVVLVKGCTSVGLRKLQVFPEERVGLQTEIMKGLNPLPASRSLGSESLLRG